MEKWQEYKINSSFGYQSEQHILAYLRACVSQEILVSIDYRSLKTEEEFLKSLRTHIDSRLHPKRIRQLEVMRARQKNGSSLLQTLSQQATLFYETGMDKNTSEEWLILLLIHAIDEAPTLTEIFKRQDEIKDHKDLLKIATSIDSGVTNSNRLLGRSALVRKMMTDKSNMTCWRCRQTGHGKSECKVPENRIFCKNCNTRKHNTHPGCKGPKEKNDKNPNERKEKEANAGRKKNQRGNNRGARRLRSPPPDRASRANEDDADLED